MMLSWLCSRDEIPFANLSDRSVQTEIVRNGIAKFCGTQHFALHPDGCNWEDLDIVDEKKLVDDICVLLDSIRFPVPSRCDNEVSLFDSMWIPKSTPREHLLRLSEWLQCNSSCFVVALIYIDRLRFKMPHLAVDQQSIHRLLIACSMMAARFCEELFWQNSYYANVGGISKAEVSKLEVALLKALDFRVSVTPSEFWKYTLLISCYAEERRCVRLPVFASPFCETFSNSLIPCEATDTPVMDSFRHIPASNINRFPIMTPISAVSNSMTPLAACMAPAPVMCITAINYEQPHPHAALSLVSVYAPDQSIYHHYRQAHVANHSLGSSGSSCLSSAWYTSEAAADQCESPAFSAPTPMVTSQEQQRGFSSTAFGNFQPCDSSCDPGNVNLHFCFMQQSYGMKPYQDQDPHLSAPSPFAGPSESQSFCLPCPKLGGNLIGILDESSQLAASWMPVSGTPFPFEPIAPQKLGYHPPSPSMAVPHPSKILGSRISAAPSYRSSWQFGAA